MIEVSKGGKKIDGGEGLQGSEFWREERTRVGECGKGERLTEKKERLQ